MYYINPLSQILLTVMLGIGGVVVIMSDPNVLLSEPADHPSLLLLFASILGNISLNLFATFYIIIRLLIHRRLMIASFGFLPSVPKLHLRVISILLESAIINLPVAITSLVCAALSGGWGHLLWQVSVPVQVRVEPY